MFLSVEYWTFKLKKVVKFSCKLKGITAFLVFLYMNKMIHIMMNSAFVYLYELFKTILPPGVYHASKMSIVRTVSAVIFVNS